MRTRWSGQAVVLAGLVVDDELLDDEVLDEDAVSVVVLDDEPLPPSLDEDDGVAGEALEEVERLSLR